MSDPIAVEESSLTFRRAWSPQRKFVQLQDSDFVPRLANEWRAKLNMLEDLDVVCRVIRDGKYITRLEIEALMKLLPLVDDEIVVCFFPLLFGSKCDCGRMHIWTDAKDASAKCLGFLEPDHLEQNEPRHREPNSFRKLMRDSYESRY